MIFNKILKSATISINLSMSAVKYFGTVHWVLCQQNSAQGRSNMSVEDDGVRGLAAVVIGGLMSCAKRVERVACGQSK